MKKISAWLLSVMLFGLASGCSIQHPVARDYPQFLSKYGNQGGLPKTDLESSYFIDAKTQGHRYEFRAATVGYAHLWIVEFGKILDETLSAPYVQQSFGKLERQGDGLSPGANLIEFRLEKYEFKNYRAYTTMNISLIDNGQVILSKSYSAEGASKGGQMWGAGPFGMKSATLDSTKSAIDKILVQFINDIPAS